MSGPAACSSASSGISLPVFDHRREEALHQWNRAFTDNLRGFSNQLAEAIATKIKADSTGILDPFHPQFALSRRFEAKIAFDFTQTNIAKEMQQLIGPTEPDPFWSLFRLVSISASEVTENSRYFEGKINELGEKVRKLVKENLPDTFQAPIRVKVKWRSYEEGITEGDSEPKWVKVQVLTIQLLNESRSICDEYPSGYGPLVIDFVETIAIMVAEAAIILIGAFGLFGHKPNS